MAPRLISLWICPVKAESPDLAQFLVEVLAGAVSIIEVAMPYYDAFFQRVQAILLAQPPAKLLYRCHLFLRRLAEIEIACQAIRNLIKADREG